MFKKISNPAVKRGAVKISSQKVVQGPLLVPAQQPMSFTVTRPKRADASTSKPSKPPRKRATITEIVRGPQLVPGSNVQPIDFTMNVRRERDNFEDFMDEYRDKVQEVTSAVMMKQFGEVDEDILDANICWMVTDNMRQLLAVGKPEILETKDVNKTIEFMEKELSKNKLLIVLQDKDKNDHWFAVIGENTRGDSKNEIGQVHIVEHTEHTCNYSESMPLRQFLTQMYSIMTGQRPDRFYGKTSLHTFQVMSYNRKMMTINTVDEFLSKENARY